MNTQNIHTSVSPFCSQKQKILKGKNSRRTGNPQKKRRDIAKSKKPGKPRILLVDDKQEVRLMLRSVLESESFSCEEATDREKSILSFYLTSKFEAFERSSLLVLATSLSSTAVFRGVIYPSCR